MGDLIEADPLALDNHSLDCRFYVGFQFVRWAVDKLFPFRDGKLLKVPPVDLGFTAEEDKVVCLLLARKNFFMAPRLKQEVESFQGYTSRHFFLFCEFFGNFRATFGYLCRKRFCLEGKAFFVGISMRALSLFQGV